MPIYTWLRPRSRDDAETLRAKQRAAQKIKALRSALETHIKAAGLPEGTAPLGDTSKLVRIATWNIREFDSSSYGYRSQEAKAYIAEILSHFDLIALQEIRRNIAALDSIKGLLGPDWDYIVTDVTEGMDMLEAAENVDMMSAVVGLMSADDLEHGLQIARIAGELWAVSDVVDLLQMPILASFLESRGEELQVTAVDVMLEAVGSRALSLALSQDAAKLSALGTEEARPFLQTRTCGFHGVLLELG